MAVFAMRLTNTIHPPGGATAIIAATTPAAMQLGWLFVPLILLGTAVMIGVGCVTNNVGRQWPLFWWVPDRPVAVGPVPVEKLQKTMERTSEDVETNVGSGDEDSVRTRVGGDAERGSGEGRCRCCGRG